MACIYGSSCRRIDDRAGCFLEFTGVHRRSLRFNNGIMAHDSLCAFRSVVCAAQLTGVGCASSSSAVTGSARRSRPLMTAGRRQAGPSSLAASLHDSGMPCLRAASGPRSVGRLPGVGLVGCPAPRLRFPAAWSGRSQAAAGPFRTLGALGAPALVGRAGLSGEQACAERRAERCGRRNARGRRRGRRCGPVRELVHRRESRSCPRFRTRARIVGAGHQER